MRKAVKFMTITSLIVLPQKLEARQSNIYKAVAFVSGKCEKLILSNEVKDCSLPKSIAYNVLKNGKILLSIPFAQDSIATFVAHSDSQPRAEFYNMYLSKIDIDSKNMHSESKLEGICCISLQADGRFWHSVSCQAHDSKGSSYIFHFTGGSDPVNVIHP